MTAEATKVASSAEELKARFEALHRDVVALNEQQPEPERLSVYAVVATDEGESFKAQTMRSCGGDFLLSAALVPLVRTCLDDGLPTETLLGVIATEVLGGGDE